MGNYRNDKIRVVLPGRVWARVDDARVRTLPRKETRLIEVPMYEADGSIRHEGIGQMRRPCLLYEAIEMPVLESPVRVTSLARWFREFIRAHHADPIVWASPPPVDEAWAEGRTPFPGVRMIGKIVAAGPDAHALIHARARREAQPASTVLRRLVRGVLGV